MVAKEDAKKHLYTACSAWYETPAGQFALQKLKDKMSEELSQIFGYFALESGALLNQHHFLDESRVGTCFSLGSHAKKPSIIADMEALPLDFDSVDLVIANHVLECSADPHQVLREIDRVLVADGHCFFIGFNPLSLWHNRHSFCDPINSTDNINPTDDPSSQSSSLSSPQLYGVRRVRDWLSLLGWKVNKISYVSFRAKFMKGKLFDRLEKMENWGNLYWPIFGNLYIIHAQKQVLNIAPKKRRKREWDPASVLPPKVAINPTPRSTQTREHK